MRMHHASLRMYMYMCICGGSVYLRGRLAAGEAEGRGQDVRRHAQLPQLYQEVEGEGLVLLLLFGGSLQTTYTLCLCEPSLPFLLPSVEGNLSLFLSSLFSLGTPEVSPSAAPPPSNFLAVRVSVDRPLFPSVSARLCKYPSRMLGCLSERAGVVRFSEGGGRLLSCLR